MSIDCTPDYYHNMRMMTDQFEDIIAQNWRDDISETFLDFIKSNYFQPLLECAKKLEEIKLREQLIVHYCYLVNEKLDPSANEDYNSEDNSENKSLSSRDEKLNALLATREYLEIEKLKTDIYDLWNDISSGQVTGSANGGFSMEAPAENKELVRTRIKN